MVESPSLELFREQLDVALDAMVYWCGGVVKGWWRSFLAITILFFSPPGGFDMVKFSLCLACLCPPVFVSLRHTLSCSAACPHVLSAHCSLHAWPPGCALGAVCTLTMCTHSLVLLLSLSLHACSLCARDSWAFLQLVSVCYSASLALSSASCASFPFCLALNQSLCPSCLFASPFHLPHLFVQV